MAFLRVITDFPEHTYAQELSLMHVFFSFFLSLLEDFCFLGFFYSNTKSSTKTSVREISILCAHLRNLISSSEQKILFTRV